MDTRTTLEGMRDAVFDKLKDAIEDLSQEAENLLSDYLYTVGSSNILDDIINDCDDFYRNTQMLAGAIMRNYDKEYWQEFIDTMKEEIDREGKTD